MLTQFTVLEYIEELEGQEKVRRQYRSRINAFSLSDAHYMKMFRFSKDIVQMIIDMVSPYIPAGSRSSALNVETKVIITVS